MGPKVINLQIRMNQKLRFAERDETKFSSDNIPYQIINTME